MTTISIAPIRVLIPWVAGIACCFPLCLAADLGVGSKAPKDAEMLIDGSREMLDQKWTYWEGPRFASALPIKWKIVEDPAGHGTVLMTDDPAAAGGKYGAADIVTKKKYRDFRLHVEFFIVKEGGNSGVYLQNRYEIQILDGDKTKHGMGALINESESPYHLYNGVGKWNAYDIVFRHAMAIDATGDHLVMGSSTGNLWSSEDGGESWALVSHALPPIAQVDFG